MSKSEAIFRAVPVKGVLIYTNYSDVQKYLAEQEDVEQLVEFRVAAKLSEKQRMYSFLFGVIMNYAMRAFTFAGYEGMDKVKARYLLSSMFAKGELYNTKTGKIDVYLLDISSMSKDRLLKFIQDCIFFLESELNTIVPDSAEWKAMKGDGFKSTKYEK